MNPEHSEMNRYEEFLQARDPRKPLTIGSAYLATGRESSSPTPSFKFLSRGAFKSIGMNPKSNIIPPEKFQDFCKYMDVVSPRKTRGKQA